MLTISYKKALYSCYLLFIIALYIQGYDITPPNIDWLANKLAYLSLILLTIILIKFKSKYINKQFLFPLLFILIFCILSVFSALINFGIGSGIIPILISNIAYILTFFVIYKLVHILSLRQILKPFLIMSVITLLLSIVFLFGIEPQYYTQSEKNLDLLMSSKEGKGLIGFSGPFINQNTLVLYSFISIVILLVNFLKLDYSKYKLTKLDSILYNPSVTLLFLTLSMLLALLTVSRAGILAILLVLVVLSIKGRKNTKIVVFTFISLAFSILLFIYFKDVILYLADRVSGDGTSHRTTIWGDAFESIKQNPLFGVGEYSYMQYGRPLSAHNVYIHYLASLGIIPSIFWLLVFFKFLSISIQNLVMKRFSNNGITILFSITFIAIAIHQAFEVILAYPFLPFTIFYFLSIAILLKQRTSNSNI